MALINYCDYSNDKGDLIIMRDDNKTNIDKTSFDKFNTKIDLSQNGSIVPFQSGGFSSSIYEKNSSKSVYEILMFYVLGIGLSIMGGTLFIKLPVFKNLLNNTIVSIVILGTIIVISFIMAKFFEVKIHKYVMKKNIKTKKIIFRSADEIV